MYKIIKTILLLTIIIFALIFFLKKSNKTKIKNQESEIKQNKPDIKFNQFALQQILKNNNKWVLEAKKGKLFKNKKLAKCQQAKANFISKNKKIAKLKADNISFDLSKNKITLDGNINSIVYLNNPTNNNRIN